MKNSKEQEWLQDYEEFIGRESFVPEALTANIFSRIGKLINPNPIIVFFKILAIHLGVGFLSLSVCHQFGMNPFNTEYSLGDWFMKVGGYNACMMGCGVSFVSISLFAAGYLLTIEEVNALKRTELLQNLSLGLISLGFFAAFGVELALGMAGLWLFGSFVGGVAATEAIWKLKRLSV